MSERLTAWFPLLLLAALAGLTFWLDRFVQPPGNGQGTAMRHDPDYIVEGLSAVRMATDGGVKHALLADSHCTGAGYDYRAGGAGVERRRKHLLP